MNTVKLTPRGYCHGVVNAINKVIDLSENKDLYPIYMLGNIVHNSKIVDAFTNLGIITLNDPSKTRLELLDMIDFGTVVFTAHGVGPSVYKKAHDKGLTVIDTSCDDVFKSQDKVKEYAKLGYEVLFIGKASHPEVESILDINKSTHIISSIEDIDTLLLDSKLIALTNQTTMSIYDIFNISERAKEKWPNIVIIDEICNATKIRQNAIIEQESDIDFCFIVGDKLSNNSNKLVEVSINQAHIPSSLISGVEDIDVELLKTFNKVSISSGASTPTKVTTEVYNFLSNFDKDDPTTFNTKTNLTVSNLLRIKK